MLKLARLAERVCRNEGLDRLRDLKRLPQWYEACHILLLQLDSNLLEVPDGLLRVESFATAEAHLSPHSQHGCMNSTPQEFLYGFLN